MIGKWLAVFGLVLVGCGAPFRGGDGADDTPDRARRQAMKYFVQAKVFEQQKNHYGAIVALRSAADLDPSSPTIYEQLARNYDDIDDFRMAETFSAKALALDPTRTPMRYLRFRLFERRGNHRAAAAELEALLEQEPANWPLYSLLARLYLETGQKERIDPLFESLLERPDAPAEVRVSVADIFSRGSRQQRAEDIYREVIAEDPSLEEAWLGLAELQLARGNRQQGIDYYLQAARQLPESSTVIYELARRLATPYDLVGLLELEKPELLYNLGLAFSDLEKYELATAVFEHIVERRPTTVDGWLDPVRYYIAQENWNKAEHVVKRALSAMPDSVALYLFWGTALERGERYAEAIEIYRRGLERLPSEVDFYLYWGFALEQQRQWPEAETVYRNGLGALPEEVELYLRWGIVLGRQSRWQEAIGLYRKAVQIDALNSDIWLHWGIAHQRLEEWTDSIQQLRRAVDLAPRDTYSLFYLGGAFEQAANAGLEGDYLQEAIGTFKRLLEINPEDAYALNYLGYLYADRGIHLEEAIELLLRAVGLDPANSAFLDSLGWAYYRLKRYDEAEKYLELALANMADEGGEELAVIFDHAGDIAQALGQNEKARGRWLRVLELSPDNTGVQRKLDGMESN
jgi:tetratricopeptide (TPR) repeat protein